GRPDRRVVPPDPDEPDLLDELAGREEPVRQRRLLALHLPAHPQQPETGLVNNAAAVSDARARRCRALVVLLHSCRVCGYVGPAPTERPGPWPRPRRTSVRIDYLLRRFGVFLLVVWLAATVNFFAPRLTGTDPIRQKLIQQSILTGYVQQGFTEMVKEYDQ